MIGLNKNMGLLKCPDCGKMVSERAAKCPECGCPSSFFVAENDEVKGVVSKDVNNAGNSEEEFSKQDNIAEQNVAASVPDGNEEIANNNDIPTQQISVNSQVKNSKSQQVDFAGVGSHKLQNTGDKKQKVLSMVIMGVGAVACALAILSAFLPWYCLKGLNGYERNVTVSFVSLGYLLILLFSCVLIVLSVIPAKIKTDWMSAIAFLVLLFFAACVDYSTDGSCRVEKRLGYYLILGALGAAFIIMVLFAIKMRMEAKHKEKGKRKFNLKVLISAIVTVACTVGVLFVAKVVDKSRDWDLYDVLYTYDMYYLRNDSYHLLGRLNIYDKTEASVVKETVCSIDNKSAQPDNVMLAVYEGMRILEISKDTVLDYDYAKKHYNVSGIHLGDTTSVVDTSDYKLISKSETTYVYDDCNQKDAQLGLELDDSGKIVDIVYMYSEGLDDMTDTFSGLDDEDNDLTTESDVTEQITTTEKTTATTEKANSTKEEFDIKKLVEYEGIYTQPIDVSYQNWLGILASGANHLSEAEFYIGKENVNDQSDGYMYFGEIDGIDDQGRLIISCYSYEDINKKETEIYLSLGSNGTVEVQSNDAIGNKLAGVYKYDDGLNSDSASYDNQESQASTEMAGQSSDSEIGKVIDPYIGSTYNADTSYGQMSMTFFADNGDYYVSIRNMSNNDEMRLLITAAGNLPRGVGFSCSSLAGQHLEGQGTIGVDNTISFAAGGSIYDGTYYKQ